MEIIKRRPMFQNFTELRADKQGILVPTEAGARACAQLVHKHSSSGVVLSGGETCGQTHPLQTVRLKLILSHDRDVT